MDQSVLLPSRLQLILANVIIPVVLIWRNGERIGVRFAPEWRPSERERRQLVPFLGGPLANDDGRRGQAEPRDDFGRFAIKVDCPLRPRREDDERGLGAGLH